MKWCWSAVCVGLVACADEGSEEELERRFIQRPVALIASTELEAECVASLMESLLWYRDRDATFTLEVSDSSARVLQGFVVGGQVGVIPAQLEENVRGQTRIALTAGGDIYGAEIQLAKCDALTVAHECGHSLGLVHVAARNLMNRAIDHSDWLLNAEQLAWIPDDRLTTSIAPVQGPEERWEDLSSDRVRVYE